MGLMAERERVAATHGGLRATSSMDRNVCLFSLMLRLVSLTMITSLRDRMSALRGQNAPNAYVSTEIDLIYALSIISESVLC